MTPIPDTYQAGQWTFSPSGMPISILTSKLAADRVLKDLTPRPPYPAGMLRDPKWEGGVV
jgi:hypothetical protein